jgi:hypothetical protein
MHILDRKSK